MASTTEPSPGFFIKLLQSKALLITTGVIVFLISLLAHIPAKQVIPNKLNGLELRGISGSLWRGQINSILLNRKPLPVQNVQWDAHWPALLFGEIRVTLTEQSRPNHKATLSYGLLSSSIELEDTYWKLPANQIQALALPPELKAMANAYKVQSSGEVALTITELSINPTPSDSSNQNNGLPLPSELDAEIEWQTAQVTNSMGVISIGNPKLTLKQNENTIQGLLTNPYKPLHSKNSQIKCNVDSRKCEATLDIRTNTETSPMLIGGLPFIGLKNTEGRWQGTMPFKI